MLRKGYARIVARLHYNSIQKLVHRNRFVHFYEHPRPFHPPSFFTHNHSVLQSNQSRSDSLRRRVNSHNFSDASGCNSHIWLFTRQYLARAIIEKDVRRSVYDRSARHKSGTVRRRNLDNTKKANNATAKATVDF